MDLAADIELSLQLFCSSLREGFQNFACEIPIGHLIESQPVFSATHDDEVIRRNHDRELTATSGRTVSILRNIGEIIRNQPELSAIEEASITRRGRGSACKSNPTLGHDAVAVPRASIQIQQTESREVAGVCVHLMDRFEVWREGLLNTIGTERGQLCPYSAYSGVNCGEF